MSFFDRFKKKPVKNQEKAYQPILMNNDVFRDLTQYIAIYMWEHGFIDKPAMRFHKDDKGFLYSFFYNHLISEELIELKKKSYLTFLYVLGMHGYAAGVYVTATVKDFTEDEFRQILFNCGEREVYELAFDSINVSMDSGLRRKCDELLKYSLNVYISLTKDNSTQPENMFAFMQVLYNAGVTSLLRV